MTPNDICNRLGEARFKSMVLDLNPPTIKKIFGEIGLKIARPLTKLGIQKRNENWADRLWSALGSKKTGAVFLYAWLGNCRNPMLAEFLTTLEVKHQYGLTDEDFLNKIDEQRLHQVAQQLLDNPAYERRDVATYLLFLDSSNQSDRFAALKLDQYL